MSERTIVGVDFSGAGENTDIGKTWATRGFLETENTADLRRGDLILLSCKPVSRNDLSALLKSLPCGAVAALDFPFSVPIAFAEQLTCPGSEMPVLWQSVAAMNFSQFKEEATEFADLLRMGDLHCSNAKPSLKMRGNPVMVNMTFRGMQMLDDLSREGFRIPPLANPETDNRSLLEVMPGAALKEFGLLSGFKKGQTALESRQTILKGLRKIPGIRLLNLPDFHDQCMFSDDALDSIVAAVVAAQWALDESEYAFKKPSREHTVSNAWANYKGKRRISSGIGHLTEEEAARREGWIYVPKIIHSATSA